MDGIQKTAFEQLRRLMLKVEGGAYGKDDEFDTDSFRNEFEDIVMLEIE